MKITDLEKFALEQVYRPYSNTLLGRDERWDRLPNHYQLDDVLIHFDENTEWRDLVMNRISRLELTFPTYIQHPLVDYIKKWKAREQ